MTPAAWTALAVAAAGGACVLTRARWVRHPLWHAAYVKARLLHPVPGRPADGSRLTPWEAAALDRITTGPGRGERSRT